MRGSGKRSAQPAQRAEAGGRPSPERVSRICKLACVAGLVSCSGSSRAKGELVPIEGLDAQQVNDAARPRKIALLIGIDRFDDPFWSELRFARKDASDLAAVLRDPSIGAFDRVEQLDESITKQDLLAAVRALAKEAPRPEDTILVYVSAHGTLALDPFGEAERVLVLKETERQRVAETGLRVDELTVLFEALPSRRKVLILATCHSGGGKSLLVPEVAARLAGLKGPVSIESKSRGSLILSAADFGQAAREDDALKNDVYTHFFVEALQRAADANGDGAVSATEAHDWARRRTFEFTSGLQLPTVHAEIAGADPVLLAGRIERPGLPVLYSYAVRLAGLEVRLDGRSKGSLPGNIVLEAGSHTIALASSEGEIIVESRIDLSEGERLSAETLVDRSRPRFAIGARAGAFGFVGSGAGGAIGGLLGGGMLSLRVRDAPWTGFDPIFDFAFGFGRSRIEGGAFSTNQRVTAYQIGAGFGFAGDFGPMRLYAGPHLSYLILQRSFELPGLEEHQRFGSFLPGVIAGAILALGSFELELQGRAHYLSLLLDGETHSTAALSLMAGGGYRF